MEFITNIISLETFNYSSAFFIGIIASISSCMVVTGGLLLSMSATFTNIESDKNKLFRLHCLFHTGRLISFFILGGLIGLIGSFFTIGSLSTFIINTLIGFIMLILGINLLGIFKWVKTVQVFIPNNFSEKLHDFAQKNHPLIPFVVGVLTFFIPCGFTQSVQFYTLGTGDFLIGGLTMLFFALGTLPVLALISFGSTKINESKYSKTIFKLSGIIVIIFALLIIWNNSVSFGIISRSDFTNKTDKVLEEIESRDITENVSVIINEDGSEKQIVKINAKTGYLPIESVANSGVETFIQFDTNQTFDCSVIVSLPSLKINHQLPNTGLTEINIGVQKRGVFEGSCGMGMFPFYIYFK